VAGDGLRGSSLLEEMIHIPTYLSAGYLGKGGGNPSEEMIEDVQIALEGMGRVVFSLQSSPVIDQLNIVHRSLPSR
jgi:hypothetical protein